MFSINLDIHISHINALPNKIKLFSSCELNVECYCALAGECVLTVVNTKHTGR